MPPWSKADLIQSLFKSFCIELERSVICLSHPIYVVFWILKEFHTSYVRIQGLIPAQGTAQAQHVSDKRLAKVVIVVVDNSRMVMVVVPANCRVDLDKMRRLLNTTWIRLAMEEEFKDIFPECELGAMPPLGNIYHLNVWIDEIFRNYPTISFNAGTHAESIQMSFADFERLVHPKEASFSMLLH